MENNNQKEDEYRERFLWIFRKTVLRIRDGKTNPIYLIRYTLFTCSLFSIKLHRIMLSDDDCMHDHPWSFISIILWGGYIEHRPSTDVLSTVNIADLGVKTKFYGPGNILWRKSPSVHKLELPEGRTATSLVITLKKKYAWGFYTPNGWVYWEDYIRSGAKCE